MMMRSRRTFLLIVTLLTCLIGVSATDRVPKTDSKGWVYILEGVGAAGISIDHSTEQDVISTLGPNYKAITHNKYSVELKYAELGLSFYYCLKDPQKKIFVIEVEHGMTSKGISVGESTLKDVFDLYGKENDTGSCSPVSCIYEYNGVHFLVEGKLKISEGEEVLEPSRMKVAQIDIVPPDKSSNFCDGFDRTETREPERDPHN